MKRPQTHHDLDLHHNQARVTYPMWIILELTDHRFYKEAHEKAVATVKDMGGEIVGRGGLEELVLMTRLPHRKYRTVEKAVAAAVNTLPVDRTIVYGRDPYAFRKQPQLRRRRDEAADGPKASIDGVFEVG